MEEPNSLVARVLKAKYFPKTVFLHVGIIIQGCSHVYKSLMWGHQLLWKGLLWQDGNGLNIDFFKDLWIPRPTSLKVITPSSGHTIKVADLIDPISRQWDVQKIDRLLLPIDDN